MKELTIEEKAKAYDNVIGKLKHFMAQGVDPLITRADVQDFFPELKDSEDERIRKSLINYVYCHGDAGDFTKKEFIAWLEKHGEKIDAIENFDTEFEKQVSRLIASAINKEHEYNEGFVKWTANALLNYAKHELEKQGEQKPTDNQFTPEQASVLDKHIDKFLKQNPDWNKEDEKILEDIKFNFEYNKEKMTDALIAQYNHFFDKIKSLKPQPKQEWSKEDDKIWRGIIAFIIISTIGCDIEGFKTWIDWLKALKERYI